MWHNRTLQLLLLCLSAALLWVTYQNIGAAPVNDDLVENEIQGQLAAPPPEGEFLVAPDNEPVEAPTQTERLVASGSESSTALPELVNDLNLPSDAPIEFLPYPNDGEPDFSRKYDHLAVGELYRRIDTLNKLMSEQVARQGEIMFETGAFVSRDESYARPGADLRTYEEAYYDEPEGLGRVWPVTQVAPLDGGQLEVRIAYVTEAEHPEYFATRDEYAYAARLWIRKTKGE